MANGDKSKTSDWLTAIKEGVAAFLGIVIIFATLFLMWPSLTSSPPNLTIAQGIFSILGGWGGVILGYYFGRLPSEKAADKANEAADSARKERDAAEKTKTLALSNYINRLGNTEKSLRAKQEKLKELAQQPSVKGVAATDLGSLIKEIDTEIAEVISEKQKYENMLG